jgi:hypothetical protein
LPGQRIGISAGGGGTERAYCRRDEACDIEQSDAAIRANLIESCSDDGIYVNRGSAIAIEHNTLLDTGGISVRFPESNAQVEANLVDGLMRARDGAVLRGEDNLAMRALQLYAGRHPLRDLFVDGGTHGWKIAAPLRGIASTGSTGLGGIGSFDLRNDLCNVRRTAVAAYGAFEDFADCMRN